jgi:hypothetical protein
VKSYKKVADLELSACSVTFTITSVLSQTARADSQQYHNHYEVQSVDMTVNDAQVSYATDGGIVVA